MQTFTHNFTLAALLAALLAVLPVALLSSCGPQSEFTTVRLVTGLEKKTSDFDLREQFLEASLRRVARTCTQKNLYAVVNSSPGGDPILETFRIPVSLNYDDSAAYTITGTYMRNNATFPPISVPVPRGVNVAVGILGSLVASQRTEGDGTCADLSAGPTPVPYVTSSVLAYRYINTTGPLDLPLNVWVLPANGISYPSPTPTPGVPECEPNDGDTQGCITRAFMKLSCPTCISPARHLRLEYAPGRLNPTPIIQWIPTSALSGPVHVPNILPMKLQMLNSGLGLDGNERIVQRSGFVSVAGGNRENTLNFIVPEVSSATTIVFTEYARKIPPIIGGFTFNTLVPPTGGILNFNWTTAANATEYAIFLNGSEYQNAGNSLSYTLNVTGFTGGTNYNFSIRARNYSQSTPVDSITYTYQHIAPFSVTYGGTPGTISANTAPVAGATIYQLWGTKLTGSGPANFSPTSGAFPIAATGLTTGDTYSVKVIATNSSYGRSETPSQTVVVP